MKSKLLILMLFAVAALAPAFAYAESDNDADDGVSAPAAGVGGMAGATNPVKSTSVAEPLTFLVTAVGLLGAARLARRMKG